MPYNPGVYDRSGEIMGNAYANIGNIIGNTITAYKQKSDENKEFESKSKAVENLIKTHANEFGVSKEQLDAYLSRDPNETPKGRYERLSGMIDNAVIGQKMKQFSQQQKQFEQQQAAGQELVNLNKYSQGQGVGVYSPDVQKKMQAQLADPMTQTAMKIRQLTGVTPDAKEISAAMATQVRDNAMSLHEVRGVDEKGNPIIQTIDQKTGRVIGSGPAVKPYRPIEEETALQRGKSEAEASAKAAVTNLNDLSANAENSRSLLADIQNIKDLYGKGATSGFGQSTLTDLQAAVSRLTGEAPESLGNQQALDAALAKTAFTLRSTMAKGTGAISDYETRGIERAAANIGKTKDANLRVLAMLQKVHERNVILDQKRSELEDKGMSASEIDRELRRIKQKMPVLDEQAKKDSPNSIDSLLEKYK